MVIQKNNYTEWQDAIIDRFLFRLVYIAFDGDSCSWPTNLYAPIHALHLPEPIKKELLKLDANTIWDIITGFTEEELRDEITFKIIIDFQNTWVSEYLEMKEK